MTKLEEEISIAFQDKFTDHEMAIAAAEVSKRYIEKALETDFDYEQLLIEGLNKQEQMQKWLKENGVI